MRIDEIEMRKGEIKAQLAAFIAEGGECDVDALEEEVRQLDAEAAEIRKAAIAESEMRNAVAAEVVAEINETKIEKEERKMENIEIRNSAEYMNAYANYIKTGSDKECRALLTENVSGGVPVPEMVEAGIRHAWESNEIMSRVRKTFVRGNLKVGFEKVAGAADMHEEGTPALDEEELELGIVNLVPESLKKWITVSDEAMDMGGEAFLRYIVDEVTAKIAACGGNVLIDAITGAPETSSATAPAVAKVTANTIAATTIAQAIGKLSDEAAHPVIIMNKASYAAFKAVQYGLGYGADIFEGCEVIFASALPSFATATSGDTYAIVGDLDAGALANFPNGMEINVKVDDMSLAEKDLVKIVGRQYVGIGVVAPFAFARIVK